MVPTKTKTPLPVSGALHWKGQVVTPPHMFCCSRTGVAKQMQETYEFCLAWAVKNILITNILHSRDVIHRNLHIFSFISKIWRFRHAVPNSHVATTEWAEWWHFALWWRMPLHDSHHLTRFLCTAQPAGFMCDLLPLESLDLRHIQVLRVRSCFQS